MPGASDRDGLPEGDIPAEDLAAENLALLPAAVHAYLEHVRVQKRLADRTCALYALDMADRKSTRLNSSHLVISYAVFCLKKKKRTKNERMISMTDIRVLWS